MANVKDKMKGP